MLNKRDLILYGFDSEGANIYQELSVASYSRPADTSVLPPPTTFMTTPLVARRVVNDATCVAGVLPLDRHVGSTYITNVCRHGLEGAMGWGVT